MSLPTSSEWEYFAPDSFDSTPIHGMERMLDDGTALDVLAYGEKDAPGEFSWLIRLWDDMTGYSVRASYDEGVYFETAEQAYDSLVGVLQRDYPWLVERDEITQSPHSAKDKFLSKLAACGIALSIVMTGMGGFVAANTAFGGQSITDCPLGTNLGKVEYSQLITDADFYKGYEALTEIMASGANTELGEEDGWYIGDINTESMEIDMLNYACYDNPMYSMYKTGADGGISLKVSDKAKSVRIESYATLQGDDFDVMYAEVDAVACSIDAQAVADANGSTANYVRSVMEQVSDRVHYTSDSSSAHCNDIYGALIYGQSRCYGFATSVKYILDKQGIPNFIATGTVAGERHAWNMVNISDTWYVVDATMSRGMIDDEGVSSVSELIDPSKYCLRTLDDMNEHFVNDYILEPETSMLLGM